MLMDVHFDNQKIESLMKKAEEQLRALDATVMQLHAAFELEGKEPPTAGTDGGNAPLSPRGARTAPLTGEPWGIVGREGGERDADTKKLRWKNHR